MAKRKTGRPSQYGFDELQIGAKWVSGKSDTLEIEKMRRAALAHGRRLGKVFQTRKDGDRITITRIE